MSFPSSSWQPPASEQERRAALRRMKIIAGGMLVVMVVIFVAAKMHESQYPWLVYVVAFSEAAIVGGLADWFAVTALFRYPMGIPLPHTAIVPKSKQRIGRALGSFIETNFLNPELVHERLKKLDLAGDVGRFLAQPAHADVLAERLVKLLPFVLETVQSGQTGALVRSAAIRQVQKTDFSRFAGAVLADLPHVIQYETVTNEILDLASTFLEENKHRFRQKLGQATDWWVPAFVDQRLYQNVTESLEDLIRELRDPEHERRQEMIDAVQRSLVKLSQNQGFLSVFNDLRDQAIAGGLVARSLDDVWAYIKQELQQDLSEPDSQMTQQVSAIVQKLGTALHSTPDVQKKVNALLLQIVSQGVLPYRNHFAQFIATVVEDWNVTDITNRIELNVGRDLQYIRINGTLVGGIVGVLVHVIWEFLVRNGVV